MDDDGEEKGEKANNNDEMGRGGWDEEGEDGGGRRIEVDNKNYEEKYINHVNYMHGLTKIHQNYHPNAKQNDQS